MDQQAMNDRANKTTNESVEATRRMRTMMEDAADAGVNTLVMLDEQGEQLNRIEEGMDQINSDMKKAEEQLTNLEKCCGCCVCPWRKAVNFESSSKYKSTWNGKNGKETLPVTEQPSTENPEGLANPGNTISVKRYYNDEREDEMEQNLNHVGALIGNLKNMAIDMGGELEKQNDQIGRITGKAEMNHGRIDGANERANKILSER